ncbi:hypothetical protein BCR34DRAFT_586518 [Clohesyomyces aquaticus]|uniref:Uncharacterized protein n=1 Tax=Clohesyomyces aquaticus TaxID=1231657 RepID=A0A1Y1ZSZ6_9PLEO|nr:hypothetical protein BCR34DRAFT_586518 [Clohesyomyces aquaticus]
MGFHEYFFYFNVQSGSIHLDEWLSLLTLSLSPLLVHIIVGVPHPVHLHHREPSWHDRIVHYNPTSIIWRYFVIADRRLRSKDWNASDMAASNALFWTADGWDGSETMMIKSRIYCERRPERARVRFFSFSAGKTLIITAQGAQSVSIILSAITSFRRFYVKFGIQNVFFPFAVLGLLRLSAALWLTEDYTYIERQAWESGTESDVEKPDNTSNESLSSIKEQLSHIATARFLSPNGRHGLSWRIFFLFFIFCLWLLPIITMLPFRWNIYLTGTLFSMGIFYFVFLSVTLFSTAACIFRHKSTSTIFPYAATMWYKVYTCVLFFMMAAMVIVAMIENRKAPCGASTTYPPMITTPHDFNFDEFLCGGTGEGPN